MSFTSEAYKYDDERRREMIGRTLTADKPYTYNEVYQAYKRKWMEMTGEELLDMPHPEKFLSTRVESSGIAYDEMLKYLCDTEIIEPEKAFKEKDMSEYEDSSITTDEETDSTT